MRIAVFIIVALVCVELTSGWFWGRRSNNSKPKTTIDAGVKAGNGVPIATIGVKHTSGGWSSGLTGSIDAAGNWGVSAGVKFSFRKRSIDSNGTHYGITFTVDQCNFNVYDTDGDGFITMNDIQSIFGEGKQAENFFNDLNLTSDDDKVDEQEFTVVAPLIIKGCEDAEIPKSA